MSRSARYLSPLRYPGGKDRLASFVSRLIQQQRRTPSLYIEPFAGGAGVGLRLLYNEVVDEIILNDLDPGIAAFWRAVFEHTNELTDLVRRCSPSVDEWQTQHERHMAQEGNDVELGFATLFLNRTNRSGILDARPIGGYDQSGRWGIAARYNADELVVRIERLARYRSRVTVSEADGIELIREHSKDGRAFIYADPPYLADGERLYMNAMTWADHVRLSKHLRKCEHWLLTYDDDDRVANDLYPGYRCVLFDIAHTAARRHVGREYAVFAPALKIDSLHDLGNNPVPKAIAD